MIIEKTAYSRKMKMCVRSNRNMAKLMCFDENVSKINWKLIRFFSNISYALVPKTKGVRYQKLKENDIKGYLCTPETIESGDIVICIHGGGMLCGSAYGSLGFSSDIAGNSGMRVYVLDYSLAPEHPFPQGIEDVYRAYRQIIQRHPDSKIFVTGESAGAYLTIVLTCMCIKNGIKKPSAIFPHSPVIDFTNRVDRTYYPLNDPILKPGSIDAIGEIYCPGQDRKDYRLSPLYFDEFQSFPPTYITVDANEYLRADSEKLYQILDEKGVETDLCLYHDTYHAFAITGSLTPETDEILKENIRVMKSV